MKLFEGVKANIYEGKCNFKFVAVTTTKNVSQMIFSYTTELTKYKMSSKNKNVPENLKQ